jgi:hypothetical protein
MHINVVKDNSGKTIATFEAAAGLQISPAPEQNFKVESKEVPSGYHTKLESLYH